MFQDYPDILTIPEIMAMLGIGKSSVYKLLQSNQIQHVRVGRKYIVPKQAVIGFLKSVWYNGQKTVGCELPSKGEEQ